MCYVCKLSNKYTLSRKERKEEREGGMEAGLSNYCVTVTHSHGSTSKTSSSPSHWLWGLRREVGKRITTANEGMDEAHNCPTELKFSQKVHKLLSLLLFMEI